MKSFRGQVRVPARAAIAGAVVVAGLTGATPAQASTDSCPTDYFYDITSQTSYQLPAPGAYFKDGPGGTMTVSVHTATTVSASGTVSAGATIGGIVAQAKVEVSATVSASTAITVGHTYSHNITAGKYGNMQYGSWGYTVGWSYYYDTPQCTTVRKSYGTAKVPTNAVGWRYWETS